MTEACAALVQRADPDRFAATMAAPPAARARLWPLYAFNLEIARAPWAASDPMIAEIRLQWWIDRIRAMPGAVPAHEVAAPLAALLAEGRVPPALLAAMAEARRRDLDPAPFDADELAAWLDATAGNLMWAAALALGAPDTAGPVVRDFAQGAGIAAFLSARPGYAARGRAPLARLDPAALARDGLAAIARARARRHLVPASAVPALWTGWQARAILDRALRDPDAVAAGRLAPSEFRRRGGLLLRALTGFW